MPIVVVLLIPSGLGVFVGAARNREDFSWRAVLGRGAVFLAPLVVVYGGWRLLPARAGGAANPTSGWPGFAMNFDTLRRFEAHLSAEGRFRFSDLYWGVFGWVDTPVPSQVLAIGFWFGVIVTIGFALAALHRAVSPQLWICAASVATTLGLVLFIEYLSVLDNANGFAQGRYFFSVAVAIVAIQMWVIDYALRRRCRLRALAWGAAPVVVVAFHLIAVLGAVIPRYFL
jgi:hypothetical protein